MRIFDFKSSNFLINKTYKISQREGKTNVSVSSPFLGNWDFEIEGMTYQEVCNSLTLYCAGNSFQNSFPNLKHSLKQNFFNPPPLWKSLNE